MIFYYSGTGNCQWVAKQIAAHQGERAISVTDELKRGSSLRYEVDANESIGFVFPVHAWNPPDTLLHFVKQMIIANYAQQYIYAIDTCGDSTGHTMQVFNRTLRQKGWTLNAKWEIQMPNNYLPLQDVDSPELEHQKLSAAAESMTYINECIASRRTDAKLMKDTFSGFKTTFIGFFFRKLGKSSAPFYATDACTGCGLCQKICLTNAISIKNKRPHWGKDCDQCYACINRCPQQAIQYGKKTETRGRYCHPTCKHDQQ